MFLEEFLVILKSISIIKAPKILPKIKDFEVFVARWVGINIFGLSPFELNVISIDHNMKFLKGITNSEKDLMTIVHY